MLLQINLHLLEFYLNRIIQYVLLSDFEIYLCCESRSFIIFLLLSSIPCMAILQFIYPFICQWIFGLFPSFVYNKYSCCEYSCTSVCMNICFHFSGANGYRMVGSYGRHMFIFLNENAKLFSQVVVPFYIPTRCVREFQFLLTCYDQSFQS